MAGDSVLVAVEFTANSLRLRLTDPEGTTVADERWPLPALADEDAWGWEVGGRIATLFAREGERRSALAIGVAAPGPVDPVKGHLLRSVDGQEAWSGLAIVETLRRHIDVPVAVSTRVSAALLAERWRGAARGIEDALLVTMRGVPVAAALIGGREVRGASFEAGSLPAVPQLEPGTRLAGRDLETAAGLLADAVALLDPALVIVDAEPQHAEPLIPLLQRVITEVAPGPKVIASALGEDGPLQGAMILASTVAYEGDRS
ncbi:MAG: ROK family protein [Dehalococcoidia bacterium]